MPVYGTSKYAQKARANLANKKAGVQPVKSTDTAASRGIGTGVVGSSSKTEKNEILASKGLAPSVSNLKATDFTTTPSGSKLEEKVDIAVEMAAPGVTKKDYEAGVMGQLNAETAGFQQTADEYGFDVNFQTPVEQTKSDLEFNQTQYDNSLNQLRWATTQDKKALSDAKKRADTVLNATKAAYATGRQGAQSTSNQKLASELAMKQQNEMDYLQTALEMKMEDRAATAAALEQAKNNNDQRAVALLSGQLAKAENDLLAVQSLQTQVAQQNLQFATDAAAAESKRIETGINNYTNFLTQGYQGSLEDAITIGQDFGLTVDQSVSLYNGYKGIMKNQGLDQEQKAAEIKRLTQDYQLQAQGLITQEQQSAKMLHDRYLAGEITYDQMEELYRAGGIDSKYNPVTQAELAYNKIRNEIQQAELDGRPIGYEQRIEEMQRLAALQEARGEVEIVLPGQSGRFPIAPANSGIVVGAVDGEALDVPSTTRNEGYCGAFVNDVLGTSLGDTFENKMSKTVEGVLPKPGMFFVQSIPGSKWGHTGIVESINSDGSVNIVEANWKGDGKITRRKNLPITDFQGFGYPANYQEDITGTSAEATFPVAELENEKYTKVLSKADGFEAEPIVKEFNTMQANAANFQNIIDSGASGPGDLAMVYQFMKALDPTSVVRESEYDSAAKSGNVFLGKFQKFNRYFGKGQSLPKNVRKEFNNLVQQSFGIKSQQYDNLFNEYTRVVNNIAGQNVASQVLVDHRKALENTLKADENAESLDPLGLNIYPDETNPLDL